MTCITWFFFSTIAVGAEIGAASVEVGETSSLETIYKRTRTRLDSYNDPSSATPGSVTSVTSTESGKTLYWLIISPAYHGLYSPVHL